jgi:hypothetical protein
MTSRITRIDARLINQRPKYPSGEVGGMNLAEAAIALTDWGWVAATMTASRIDWSPCLDGAFHATPLMGAL